MKERTQWQHSGAKLQRTGCTDNPILHSLSAAERLCHLPFQPTERCAALKDTSSESSFVRVDTNQHYTTNVLTSDIWGIPVSEHLHLLKNICFQFCSVSTGKKEMQKALSARSLKDYMTGTVMPNACHLGPWILFFVENVSIFI